MTLTDVVAAPGVLESELLRLAAAVESASEHPIAAAITAGAVARLAADRPRPPRASLVTRHP